MQLDVKVDISENARFIDKVSVLGVATDDGSYRKNVYLEPKVKRRITGYAGKVEEVHSILVYNLIKDELSKYSSLTICHDISKNKLRNYLRLLFKSDKYWNQLEQNKSIKIISVKGSFVDAYVKEVRKGIRKKGFCITLSRLRKQLKLFNRK
ncbi:MAG: hypothetical protein V1734_01560 [Nanoarchaeota archaeon]